MTGGEVANGEAAPVLTVVVSPAGTVELCRGASFGDEHADLAADVAAAVRRVLDAYAAIDAVLAEDAVLGDQSGS